VKRTGTINLLGALVLALFLQTSTNGATRITRFQSTSQDQTRSQNEGDNWREYEGRYEINPHQLYNFIVDIVVEDEGLSARLSHRQKRLFSFKATDEFLDQETGRITLTFTRNRDFKIVGLKIHDVSMTYYVDEMHNVASRMIPGKVELSARKIDLPPPSLTGNTTFILKSFANARIVSLAGSFNHWNQSETLFAKEGDHWICRINLPPGKYLYKFVVDGSWIVDPDNPRIEDDGLGNLNSVREIK
jgi:hypothetical protein